MDKADEADEADKKDVTDEADKVDEVERSSNTIKCLPIQQYGPFHSNQLKPDG